MTMVTCPWCEAEVDLETAARPGRPCFDCPECRTCVLYPASLATAADDIPPLAA